MEKETALTNKLSFSKYKRKVYTDEGLVELEFEVKSARTEKVVDDSHFKPSSEIKRDRVAVGNAGSSDRGLYDSDKGKDYKPTDIEQALRSGVFDKADIQVLQEQALKDADKSVEKKREKDALDAERAKVDSRQQALDKVLGVNQDNSASS